VYSKLRIVWKTVKEANLTLSMQAWVYLIFMLYVLWYNITLITCLFLSLRSTIHVHLESSTPVTLPSLKMLLIHINHMEVPSVNILLCGCPNIETLKLRFASKAWTKFASHLLWKGWNSPLIMKLGLTLKWTHRILSTFTLTESHMAKFSACTTCTM